MTNPLEIPKRCLSCPKIGSYLEGIESAKARRKDTIETAEDFMRKRQGVLDSFTGTLEEVALAGSADLPKEDLIKLFVESGKEINEAAAEKIETVLVFFDKSIEIRRNCIEVLIKGCVEGVQLEEDDKYPTECGSEKIAEASETFMSGAEDLVSLAERIRED